MLTSVQNVCVVTTFYTLESMKSIFLPKFVFFRSRLRLSLKNTNLLFYWFICFLWGVALRIITYPPPSRREAISSILLILLTVVLLSYFVIKLTAVRLYGQPFLFSLFQLKAEMNYTYYFSLTPSPPSKKSARVPGPT